MSCIKFEIEAFVNEGDFAVITYTLSDEDGDPINAVDLLEWKLSDGTNILVDWTEVVAPDLPSGTIKILGEFNRVTDLIDRFFTLHANYSSGVDDSFETTRYQIINSPNVTTTSPT